MREWTFRKDLNFCPECWFGAKIEAMQREIGPMYLCKSCGTTFPSPDGEIPQSMSDDEFDAFHKEYAKGADTRRPCSTPGCTDDRDALVNKHCYNCRQKLAAQENQQ